MANNPSTVSLTRAVRLEITPGQKICVQDLISAIQATDLDGADLTVTYDSVASVVTLLVVEDA